MQFISCWRLTIYQFAKLLIPIGVYFLPFFLHYSALHLTSAFEKAVGLPGGALFMYLFVCSNQENVWFDWEAYALVGWPGCERLSTVKLKVCHSRVMGARENVAQSCC